MSAWIEARDVPWAAATLARAAWDRARPGSPERAGQPSAEALEVARQNIERTLGGDPAFPDVASIISRHRDFVHYRAPAPGSRAFEHPSRWPVRGREHLDAALGEGRGAMLVTGHLGWWLLIAPILRSHGVPVVQTGGPYFERRRRARSERARSQSRFRRFVDDRTRPASHLGPEDIAVGIDVRPIFAALGRNRPLLIAGDGKRALEFVSFPLLGRAYLLPPGFIKIAMAARCPVLPVFALDDPGRQRVRVVIRPALSIDPGASPVENLAAYARALDDQLRETPHLWTRWTAPDPFDERRRWVEETLGGRSRDQVGPFHAGGQLGQQRDQKP